MEDFYKIRELSMNYIVAVAVATEVPPDSPDAEFMAVIDVMRNRAKTRALSLVEVVLQKNQFSAVCREEYWRRAMAGKWINRNVERAYEWVLRDWIDITDGATYYFSPISMKPQDSMPRDWNFSKLEEVEIFGVRPEYFRFFKEIA